MSFRLGLIFQFSPQLKRSIYRKLYEYLSRRYRDMDWPFMNYGYADLDGNVPRLSLRRADERHRYQIQLYHRVTRTAVLSDRFVLEVSCGRGGGAAFLKRYLQPRAVVGVDFSQHAIAYCARTYNIPGLVFVAAEAEALPFASETFDQVVNIEASHCYGSMERFLAEAHRVLRPLGYLCFADVCERHDLPTLRQQLKRSGMSILYEEVITPNVLRALNLDSKRKHAMIQQWVPPVFRRASANFVRIRGTPAYEALRRGRTVYVHALLRKETRRGM